jgi:hypothetical protein
VVLQASIGPMRARIIIRYSKPEIKGQRRTLYERQGREDGRKFGSKRRQEDMVNRAGLGGQAKRHQTPTETITANRGCRCFQSLNHSPTRDAGSPFGVLPWGARTGHGVRLVLLGVLHGNSLLNLRYGTKRNTDRPVARPICWACLSFGCCRCVSDTEGKKKRQ